MAYTPEVSHTPLKIDSWKTTFPQRLYIIYLFFQVVFSPASRQLLYEGFTKEISANNSITSTLIIIPSFSHG